MVDPTVVRSPVIIGAVVAVVVVGGVVGYQMMPKGERGPETSEVAPEVTAPPPQTAAATENPSPSVPPSEALPDIIGPSFDVVRIDENRSGLVAGRAEPRGEVTLLLDGVPLAEVSVDGAGSFIILTEIPGSDHPQALRLSLTVEAREGALLSEETVFIAPREVIVAETVVEDGKVPAPDLPAEDSVEVEDVSPSPVVVTEVITPQEDPASGEATLSEVVPNLPDTVEEVAAAAAPKLDPVAAEVQDRSPEAADPVAIAPPQVVVADSQGVTVLSEATPSAMASVALDTITYDSEGEVVIAGRAPGEGFVRIYIDDQPVTTSRIEGDGRWKTALPEVDAGVYRLRVDEIDGAGEVASRIETPFKKEEQEAVQTVLTELEESGQQAQFRTVQPGNTLWAIATEKYGDGALYVRVFEANQELIRDPNLIYPGQVFSLPN